ncbi:MAG TPA: hypothetical protein VK968_00855 [Roseimicrobium sp.]|nr:hypothetical protein [Roseimicrobium sp.]
MNPKQIMAVLVLLCTVVHAGPPATKPASPSLDDIAKGVAAAEAKIKTICVRNFVTPVSTQQKDATRWTDTPMKYAGTAWYESPESARARVHFTEVVMKWEDGAAPWSTSSEDLSFDGKIGRSISLASGAWNRKPNPDRQTTCVTFSCALFVPE